MSHHHRVPDAQGVEDADGVGGQVPQFVCCDIGGPGSGAVAALVRNDGAQARIVQPSDDAVETGSGGGKSVQQQH